MINSRVFLLKPEDLDQCDIDFSPFIKNEDDDFDPVNRPKHYCGKSGMEAYTVLEEFLSDEELKGWHKGCAVKYVLRAGKKDPNKEAEDYRKAVWHLNNLADISDIEKEAENAED